MFAVKAAILVVANIITTSALKGGYEHLHIYNYSATVSVEVNGHTSEYLIDGHLKIQRDVKSNQYMLSLSNLNHNYYYGMVAFAKINESNLVDNRVLQSPFYVVYDEIGMFKSIEYPSIEPTWSKKIKKSIASLLQFDWPIVMTQLDKDTIEETTVHGKCKVDYKRMWKLVDGRLPNKYEMRFMRIYALNSCDEFTNNVNGYLTDYVHTKKTIEDIHKWSDSSIRNYYDLNIVNNDPIITMILNTENYNYNDNIDEVAFIKDSRQILVKIRQFLTLHDTSSDEICLPEDFQNYDVTNIDKTDTKGLVDRIIDLLAEAHDYMKDNHLEIIDQGEEHRQLFNKILFSLKRLKLSDFSILESKVTKNPNFEKSRNILVQILPYVGTEYSLDFVLNIISTKTISDELAINLLAVLPNHAQPTITTIERFKSVLLDNNYGESELSPTVYENAVLSFSNLLNRISLDDDAIVTRYFPNILQAFKGAKTTASKLIFLAAIGNIRDVDIVNKYTLPILASILTRRDEIEKDQDRIRLAAINILSELISAANVDIFEILKTKILNDKNESKLLRLAAYDVIIRKSNYAIDVLANVGSMISDDKNLYNYHLSAIEGLQQIGILDGHAKIRLNPSNNVVSFSLSRSVTFKTDSVLKSELLKSTLKLPAASQTYMKLSFVYEDQSRISNGLISWQIPSMAKFEIFNGDNKNSTLIKAFYLHTNFKGLNVDKKIFFDYWTVFNENSRMHHVSSTEYKNLPSLLELTNAIFKKMHESLIFTYKELTTFSITTGFGIDAVFEHKYPSLVSTFVNYNWKSEDNCLEAKVDLSLKEWSNGYSGVSVFDPLSGLTHSIRKTQKLDSTLSISVIVKYDFSNHQLNFTVPVFLQDFECQKSGMAVYSSTTVAIIDANEEISCKNCGFKITSRRTPVSFDFRRFDHLGLLVSRTIYNCDSKHSLELDNFFGKSGYDDEVNTCGFIAMIKPNSSKPFSQIELLMDMDAEHLKNYEKSWYFLPGYKLSFALLIGSRQIITDNFNNALKLDFAIASTQGHLFNLLQFRLIKRNDDENNNFILCIDGKVAFPEIDDNYLPTEITDSKLNAFLHIAFGLSDGETCSEIKFYFNFNVTGEVSKMQKSILENHVSNSRCAKQKSSPLYVYPRGLYPLTEDCVREMISNTTFRRYILDVTSEKFSEFSLLQALLIIRSMQDKVKEFAANSHNANVEVSMISPISEIRSRKQMSFQVDYPVTNIYENLPNMYFSQEFLLNFINERVIVINIYPETIVFNNEEKPLPRLNGWNEIYTGVDKTPYKIYRNVLIDDRISLKILYNNDELIVKPKLISARTIDSSDSLYVPEIYYNQQVISDFHQIVHLFSSRDILFSLSRVDDYMVIRSTEIPVIIYYTTNSITIFQNK